MICAELVKDFLEFYKLDYTLSIYMPEVNLTQQNSMSKDELSTKVGLKDGASVQKPLMMQLLEGFISNEGPSTKPMMEKQEKKEEQKPVKEQVKSEPAP